MAWEVGTITDATPALRLQERVENVLGQVPGWSFIEEVIISGTTHRVWYRSHATYPFYIILRRTSAQHLYVGLCEGYDQMNHQAIRPAPADNNPANVAVDGSKGNGTGYALSDTSAIYYGTLTALPTTGFTYIIQATTRHLIFSAWVGSTGYLGRWVGRFTPLWSNDPYPVANSDAFSNASLGARRQVAYTRQVGVPPASGTFGVGAWNGNVDTFVSGNSGTPSAQATFPSNPCILVGPFGLSAQMKDASGSSTINVWRGIVENVVAHPSSTTFTHGDRFLQNSVETHFVVVGSSWALGIEEV
jgi:hypothetical protein